jgi:hypothetical protein
MCEVGLRFGELISQIDVLDQAYDLTLFDPVAFEQVERFDSACDSAGDINFGRFDHPDRLDLRAILRRPQIDASEKVKPDDDPGEDRKPDHAPDYGSYHCAFTGL